MTYKGSRRQFITGTTSALAAVILPGTFVKEVLKLNAETTYPVVTDKETSFITDPENKTYRPLPDLQHFRYYPELPVIESVQPVPFPWGHENFYSGSGGYLTDNVYLEPGKPWVLQLAISTPGKADSSAGSPLYKTWYRVSVNGGKTFSNLAQVIVNGNTSKNPISKVEIGRNGFNVDFTRPIVRASNGEIMVPVGLHPWDEEKNQPYRPVGGYLFQDAGVLIGTWLADGTDIKWQFGSWLRIDYNESTRGLSEPTIVEMKVPGKFAMVTRCSNSGQPGLPGYARVSVSEDYCRSWSALKPFTYSDGSNFFVPTSHSTLFKSKKKGRIYWIGNLNETNPNGSHPRYPLVIGEVDAESFGLIRNSVTVIDTRHIEKEGPLVQLSNFKIMENPDSNELLVVCTRIEGTSTALHPSWYRIQL
jgi:hypothetical protein